MKNKKIAILILSLLIVGVLAIYYAKPFIATPSTISFDFNKVGGDSKEIDHLHYVATGEYDTALKLEITPKETRQEESVSPGSIYTIQSPNIGRWQKEYRSFMRKKESSEINFFEDEDFLYYIGDYSRNWSEESRNHVTVHMERLDKETKQVTTKKIEIESPYEVQFVSYQTILKAGPYSAIQLAINTSQNQMYHTYIYNWETEEVVDERIEEETNDNWTGNMNVYIEVLNEENPKFLLHTATYSDEQLLEEEDGSVYEEIIENKYQVYDPSTQESKEVSLPKDLNDEEINYIMEDGNIMFTEKQKDGFSLTTFNVGNQRIVQENMIPVKEDTFSEEGSFFVMKKDSKLLITQSYIDPRAPYAGILVIDVDTLDKRYEGKMELDEKSKDSLKNQSLYFESIYFE